MPVSKPSFSAVVDFRLGGAHAVALLDEGRELRIFCRRGLCQRMVRRQRHELGAEQSVRPRGENFQLAFFVRRGCGIERKAQQQTFRAPDPVLLHQADFVRPAIERVERLQQIFRIVADLEEPLCQFALFDFGARAPAAAIDDLFVGEHGLIDRIPVHFRLLALDQSRLEKVEKHLLLMLVVGRDRRSRSRAPSRAKAPSTEAAFSSPRCCRRSRLSDAPCGRWRRFQPACRRHPSPSGAARRYPWRV